MWGNTIPDLTKAKTPQELEILDALLKRFLVSAYKITPIETDKLSPRMLHIWNKIAIVEKEKDLMESSKNQL